MPRKGFRKKFAEVAVNFGSIDKYLKARDERKTIELPEGAAHFLEHQLFERPGGNAFDDFYGLGAKANASTTYTSTSFYFTCTESFFEGLEVLLKMVTDPYFTSENIDKERNIIAQEIRMLEDDPEWRLYFNLLSCMYKKHPVRNKIAGDIESIRKIDRCLLQKCFKSCYGPSNMVLFIAGDFEKEDFEKGLKGLLKELKLPEAPDVVKLYPEEPAEVDRHEIRDKLPVAGHMFALGYKENVDKDESIVLRMVTAELLLEMLTGKSSDLYGRLYDEGLIDLSYKAGYTGEEGFGHAVFSGRSKDCKKTAEYIRGEISDRIKDPWKEEIFLKAKRKKWGEWVRSFNSLEGIGHSFTEMYFKGIPIFEYIEVLDRINFQDILKRLEKLLDPDFSCMSVIIPKN